MRQLVPTFISERLAAGQRAGRLAATCLFVDTAGFTPLTSALMAYGVEGTEVTAQILHTIFEPLVRAVYACGGFVAGFAGDSLKAVFPGTDRDAARRCLLAADAMRQHMAAHTRIATRFGTFDFAAKICLADGDVSWSIWQSPAALRQSAAYTFSGPGLARCLELDALAEGGEIALTTALAARIDPAMADLERRDSHALLLRISPGLAARHQPAPLPAANPAAARRFMPDSVLGLRAEGEFRQVVTVFLNLRKLPAGAEGDAFLARFFAMLERHGGYLCRIGRIGAQDDGATALLFWGAPVSFERDLQRALDFLGELRRESPSPLRAGVTSQLAYAGFVGADIHAEYTCYGAAVNLAARLMVRAGWGEALLDEDATRQARATHRCLPRGEVPLKGFAAEQPIFALQDSRNWRPAYERPPIGRGRELARLRELLAPLRSGRAAGTILLTGEAGMGKSRLLAAAQESSPFQWLHCPADRVARESLHPFRAFLRHHFGSSPALSREENLGLFQFGLESLGAAVPDPALRRELEAAAPYLAALIDLPWPDQPAEPPEGQERFAAAVSALKTLFKAESLCQPVVIEVEDGHWLDGDSLACLQHIGRNIAAYPLAIVVAAREAPAGLTDPSQSIPTLALRPLDAAELGKLAAQLLGGPASREHLVALAERSEGNPYLAEQLLLADIEDQVADARATTPHDDDSGLPATARALLTARIDRLEPAVRHAVQVAAVLGREVAPELLRAMLDNDPALPDQLRAAAAAGIWQATADGQLLFSHDLLRDAAYDMQLRSWRRRMHGRAAALLAPAGEPGLVAHH